MSSNQKTVQLISFVILRYYTRKAIINELIQNVSDYHTVDLFTIIQDMPQMRSCLRTLKQDTTMGNAKDYDWGTIPYSEKPSMPCFQVSRTIQKKNAKEKAKHAGVLQNVD